MSHRQIILDTETTGLRIEEGHRLIEIGCMEMIDRKLTGNHFHHYVNPEREIDAGAMAVHGITNEFIQDKPLFAHIAQAFIDYIADAELIIHNAPFDLGFLNNELALTRKGFKPLTETCEIIDTLRLARQLHAGQRNSLDALCKRYGVDNSKREWHGALLDAHLLAHVYLAMTGGQGSFFDGHHETPSAQAKSTTVAAAMPVEKHQLTVLMATPEELDAHAAYINALKKQGKCVWE
jgi:DNA polymerase-3 subunit epsilon